MSAPRNTPYELVYHVARGNVPQAEIPGALHTIFEAPEYKDLLRKQLAGEDLRLWVERLDEIVSSRVYPEEVRNRALRALRKTCGTRQILPRSHYFQGGLRRAIDHPAAGGTAEVWKVEDNRRQLFGVKVFRVTQTGDEYKIKRYYKEITIWKRLDHPNVVPTLGAEPSFAEFCVVAPWMPGGDLLQFLNRHPEANRLYITIGIADGLTYLHSKNVIHGDMKGQNVLFDGAGVPRISDFGATSITIRPSANASTPSSSLSIRWAAPELLEPSHANYGRPTFASDVYSFAVVVTEVFTGQLPFLDLGDYQILALVSKGKHQPKPSNASKLGLSSSIWKILEGCWDKKPNKRPGMPQVADRLRRS